MLRHKPYKPEENLIVGMASVGFSFADRETKVSTYAFHTMLGSHGNSWETMATS